MVSRWQGTFLHYGRQHHHRRFHPTRKDRHASCPHHSALQGATPEFRSFVRWSAHSYFQKRRKCQAILHYSYHQLAFPTLQEVSSNFSNSRFPFYNSDRPTFSLSSATSAHWKSTSDRMGEVYRAKDSRLGARLKSRL